jgi:hypothetical protein
LIGKSITATGTGNTTVTGNVTGVQLSDGIVNLKLDNGQIVPAANVMSYGTPMQTAVGSAGGVSVTP